MGRIHGGEETGYFFEQDGHNVPLNQETYIGFKSRKLGWVALKDVILVQDDRDGQYFTFFRYDQPPEAFELMMGLFAEVGYLNYLDDHPEFVEEWFRNQHPLLTDEMLCEYIYDSQLTDDDVEKLLEGGNE